MDGTGAQTALAALVITIALVCGYTYASSWIDFRINARHPATTSEDVKQTATEPPLLPYFIPVLGSVFQFSNQTIGAFWSKLAALSRKSGVEAFSIMLVGTRTHFIFSPTGVEAFFRSRDLSRAKLDQQLGTNALGMSQEDAVRAFPYEENKEKTSTARIHTEHLLSAKAVDGLTGKFMEIFTAQLSEHVEDGTEVDLYAWLWQSIFRASTMALCGEKLLEMYPDFDTGYRVWEDSMLGLLFGTPRLFAWSAYKARDACVAKLKKWLEEGYQHQSAEDLDWEPWFGARVMRKRHEYYQQQGLTLSGQASADLIFLAGIVSNATPCTGWLLLHILDPKAEPKDFRDRIMVELRSVHKSDGSIDIPALTRLPLLNSAFHEVLRLYGDTLAVRQVDHSTSLGPHYVRQGEQVMAPTWLTHRNSAFFDDPESFNPERFLVKDASTGETTYSLSGLGGKYFPFGGGHYMCPGRIFAKQEVLGCVAVLLLNYNVDSVGQQQFPSMKKNFAGGQVVGIQGDARVTIGRK